MHGFCKQTIADPNFNNGVLFLSVGQALLVSWWGGCLLSPHQLLYMQVPASGFLSQALI